MYMKEEIDFAFKGVIHIYENINMFTSSTGVANSTNILGTCST
jgi:hypothetical protein